MSNEFLQASDDARRLLAGFAAVQTVADAFAKVGTLQQAQAEAESALASLTDARDAARADLVAARAELDKVTTDTQALVAQAALRAAALDNEAQARLDAAIGKAQSIVAAAEDEATVHHETLARDLTAYNAGVRAANEELDAINAKIAAAKASVADLLK